MAEVLNKTTQYRHHGAHRRRQDDGVGAHPLLHRQDVQDGRGPRRHRRHGLPGGRAEARHHDHVGRDEVPVEGLRDQPDRHARAHRLHRRGRAVAAGAGRRGGGLRRQRGRPGPERNRLAAGPEVRPAVPVLHQQDGQDRRGFRDERPEHPREAAAPTRFRCRFRSERRTRLRDHRPDRR